LQTAHYVDGRRIADESVLFEIAAQMNYAHEAFVAAFKSVDTQAHVKASRALLARLGGQGFPTFALEQDGQFTLIDISPWLGKPQAFADWLGQASVVDEAAQSPAQCGLDGCA
jgi:putative protein-disulfide isomerase